MLSQLLERLFPLLPPEKRRVGIIPVAWLDKNLTLERDGDYLTFICFKFLIAVSFALVLAILLDNKAATNFFVQPDAISAYPFMLSIIYTFYARWVVTAVTLGFYLRIRTTIDLRTELIPLRMRRHFVANKPPRSWIFYSAVLIAFAIVAAFKSDLVVLKLLHHFHKEDSIPMTLLFEAFTIYVTAGSSCVAISMLLAAEKAIRFFPEVQAELLRPDYEPPSLNNKK